METKWSIDGKCIGEISSSAFSNCACLRQVRLPSRLDKIESSLFQNCSGLAEMRIPGKVNYVLSTAFGYCTGIEDYYFYFLVLPSLSNSNVFLSMNDSCRIHVPKGSLEAYQTANLWSELADRMVEMEEGEVY
ncbi:MAG: leucine-rich repeat protein [Oliverpabstia sp.]